MTRAGRGVAATVAGPTRRRRRAKVAASLTAEVGDPLLRWIDGDWRPVDGPGTGRSADRGAEHLAAVAVLLEKGGIEPLVSHRHHNRFELVIPPQLQTAALAALRAADPKRLLHLGRDGTVERLGGNPVLGDIDQSYVWRYRTMGRDVVAGRGEACTVSVDAGAVATGTIEVGGREYRATSEATTDIERQTMPFPIDVVYTWVDGDDPEWRSRFNEAWTGVAGDLHPVAANPSRYTNRDELRYSLRSLWEFTDFARTIWVVTDGQVPAWLSDHPQVRVIDHRDIFPDAHDLPTFNSHAIEANLHRIEGLADHYLYLNDDFFFAGPSQPGDFFAEDGSWRFYPDIRPIGAGPADGEDEPEEAAAKNGRDVMAALGHQVSHKLRHIPYAQRRSAVAELEEKIAPQIAATSSRRFRDAADLSIAASLIHHYGEANGMAQPSQARYQYLNVINRWSAHQMRLIAQRRDLDFFCVNETLLDEKDHTRVNAIVNEFLEAYFPHPSPYERE